MNAFEELKFKVYESDLDWDEKSELIDAMESCDDDNLEEVCESVECLLEESAGYPKTETYVKTFDDISDFADAVYKDLDDILMDIHYQIEDFKTFKKAAKASAAVATVSGVSSAKFIMLMKKTQKNIKKLEDKVDSLDKMIKKFEKNSDPDDKQALSKLKSLKKDMESKIAKYKKAYSKYRVMAIATGAVTAGAIAVGVSSAVAVNKYGKSEDPDRLYVDVVNDKNKKSDELRHTRQDLSNRRDVAKNWERNNSGVGLPKRFERKIDKAYDQATIRYDSKMRN